MCAYYVQLFHRPEFLVSRFTKQQLEEGFWAIMRHTVEWSTANIIDDSNLPLSSRKDCIESMAVLFERLFANEPLDNSVHMWWHFRIFYVTHGTAGIGIKNAVVKFPRLPGLVLKA